MRRRDGFFTDMSFACFVFFLVFFVVYTISTRYCTRGLREFSTRDHYSDTLDTRDTPDWRDARRIVYSTLGGTTKVLHFASGREKVVFLYLVGFDGRYSFL